jgi:broad specificity phosphatase PhoE
VTGPGLTGTLHLVRHGEVENPMGIIYGRLPGYNLSERGRRQAKEAAEHLADSDVGVICSSPLERALETADAIAELHSIEVEIDDRVTESQTDLQGVGGNLRAFIMSPRVWWRLRSPWRPSWGESFADVRSRMLAAAGEALHKAAGREAVIVSHQAPVVVARLALARRRVPPWLSGFRCQTGSVTTMILEEGRVTETSYFVPSS